MRSPLGNLYIRLSRSLRSSQCSLEMFNVVGGAWYADSDLQPATSIHHGTGVDAACVFRRLKKKTTICARPPLVWDARRKSKQTP